MTSAHVAFSVGARDEANGPASDVSTAATATTSESPKGPAGGGAAAANYIHKAADSSGSSAAAPMVPRPPPGSPDSKRPHPQAITPAEEVRWRETLKGLLPRGSNSISGDTSSGQEALHRCATLAVQLQSLAEELIRQSREAGLDEAALKAALSESIFGRPIGQRSSAMDATGSPRAPEQSSPRASGGTENARTPSPRALEFTAAAGFVSASASAGRRQSVAHRRQSVAQGSPSAAFKFDFKHLVGGPAQLYHITETVGVGGFGTVKRARHRQTGQIHAVKSVQKPKPTDASSNQSSIDELWAEIDIVKQLDHPHIYRLYYTFEDDLNVYMAVELCTGGPFFNLLCDTGFLQETSASRFFRQIMSAVTHLHCRSICHRDLKPENFLLLKEADPAQCQLKLIDFGTSRRFDITPLVTKVCTPHYVAPDVLCKEGVKYTEKVDIWSCGVMLYQMLCGRMPFHREDELQLLRIVKKGQFEFKPQEVWDLVSRDAHELIMRMLRVKVVDRCTAFQALHHEWTEGSSGTIAEEDEAANNVNKKLMRQIHEFLLNNRLKRVALHIIARQIQDDAIGQLRSIFLSIDEDHSGTLTIDEMYEAVSRLGVEETEREGMVELICQLDPTGAGVVEYTEFLAATMDKSQYLQPAVCKAAFLRLDGDGDGVLSMRDLAELISDEERIKEAGLSGSSLGELEQIMMEVDKNRDGGVSFEEFMGLMGEDGTGQLHAPTALSIRRKRLKGKYYEFQEERLNLIFDDVEPEDIDSDLEEEKDPDSDED